MAISPFELRIGNWILPEHDLDGKYHVVKELSKNVVNNHIESWYSPIPLTPEILEGCGLNTSIENIVYDLPGCWEYKGVKINYLHQLQNLYFALTGTELAIKLPVTA